MGRFCVFCGIVNGEVETQKILESKNFFVILDNNPKAEMHSLIIPKKHFATFLDLPKELYKECLETTRKAIELISKKTRSRAFNLLLNNLPEAGQVVEHLHLHIIPRKKGDEVNIYY